MEHITISATKKLHHLPAHFYSTEQALTMARCAKITYSLKINANKLLKKINFNLKYFNKDTPPFLIAENTRYIVIAFKGIQKLNDSINILKFFWTETKVKRIHNGFKNMYDKVHYPISFHLSQLPKKKPIYLTGHSLGGVLAVIAASRLTGFHIAGCYTFGAPPIGITELDHPIHKPVYEIANDDDPFSHLDKCSSYCYIGSRYVLTENEIFQKTKKHQSKINKLSLPKAFKAHSMKEYLSRLETTLNNTKKNTSY